MAVPARISQEFERRLGANARYSLRAFARDLGISPGHLSEALSGKRPLTPKALLRIATRLGWSAIETREALGAAAVGASGLEQPDPDRRELSLDSFRVVSEWHYFAILNLFDVTGFRADPAWISRRLGIAAAEAKIALERLERVGLLRRERGRLVPDTAFALSPSGIPSDAIRAYHRRMLEKASQALDGQSVTERDITGQGMTIDPRDLPEIVADLRALRDRIAKKYARGRRTEVYQLQIALFRLTQKGKES